MFVSIDVGGTNTRLVSANSLLEPVFLNEPVRQRNTNNFEQDIAFIIRAARTIACGHEIDAIGIGTAGTPNSEKTGIETARNLTGWVGKPLVAALTQGLSCHSVYYDTDVTAAGLGEAYYGSTEGDFDYITWGTGIGGAAIRYEDDLPTASVFNWQTRFKNWIADVGGSELSERFGKPPESFTATEWNSVVRDFKRHLEEYVSTFIPPAIVFGGGLAVRHQTAIEDAGSILDTPIKVTSFGNDSGLMGGFGLIRHHLESTHN